MIKKFKNWKLISEGFRVSVSTSYRTMIEQEWGLTIEDIEDILLEIPDLANERCLINTPTYDRRVKCGYNTTKIAPSLIILCTVNGIDRSQYESVMSTIRKRFLRYDIDVIDGTIGHDKTNIEIAKYFFCLRLVHNRDLKLMPDRY